MSCSNLLVYFQNAKDMRFLVESKIVHTVGPCQMNTSSENIQASFKVVTMSNPPDDSAI